MTLSLFKGVNGMTLWGKDYEIALYYLYMIADGELSPEEMTIFKSICQKLGKMDEYQNIITYCKGLGQTSSFNKIVDEDLVEVYGSTLGVPTVSEEKFLDEDY